MTAASRESDVQATGHDALAEIMSGPEAEVTADGQVISDVIADDPERDHDLRAAGPERATVVAVDQGLEDLGVMGIAVLGAEHHPVRPGAELRARNLIVVRAGRH
jgi:hypothetical protein